MKDPLCGRAGRAWLAVLASSMACGCSGGEWFPEVDGPPRGDERLYYSGHNPDPAVRPARAAGVESDEERAYQRKQERRRD